MSWQYVAGFFDGEGSISQAGACRTPCAYIQITQKDRRPLDAIVVFLQERGIVSRVYARNDQTGIHNLVISSKANSARFLENVRPYLIVKKSTTEDAWRLMQLFPRLKDGPSRADGLCKRGHELDGVSTKGYRYCRICKADRQRERLKRGAANVAA